MKRERIHLPGGASVETGRDWNGRYYIACARNASVFMRSGDEVKRFMNLPAAHEASLDSWLASLPVRGDED